MSKPASRWRFCVKCQVYKLPRMHHCSVCNRCCVKYDHHCAMALNCIGINNFHLFVTFLSSTIFVRISYNMTCDSLCFTDWWLTWRTVSSIRRSRNIAPSCRSSAPSYSFTTFSLPTTPIQCSTSMCRCHWRTCTRWRIRSSRASTSEPRSFASRSLAILRYSTTPGITITGTGARWWALPISSGGSYRCHTLAGRITSCKVRTQGRYNTCALIVMRAET